MKKTLLTFVFGLLIMGVNAQVSSFQSNNLLPFGGSAACVTWGQPSASTGWTNFNTQFGGAPCNDGTGCPFNEINTFEVWQGEAYAMNNVIAGGSYTFSICNGPGAGSWSPDFTIIAPGGGVDAFGPGTGCAITWTASTSGAYLIVINQLGNCGFVGTTNNGFPAITCNGTPSCTPPGECSAGELASTAAQFVCPGESALFETDGSENIPLAPGGYALVFTPTTGTGGIDDVLTLYGVELPYSFDADLNGILSFNDLPPFAGEWSISGFAFTDAADLEGTLCSETSESFLVTFLSSIDPLCGGTCPEGEILDCNGNCAPANWVGDTFCDDGTYEYNGVAIFFNCAEFGFDGGDCEPGTCPEGEILDCNGNCAPANWVGDTFCDDGTYEHNGVAIFFNCEEFDFDGGDCETVTCPEGEILDCNGNCAPANWVGDTFCDDGTYEHNGVAIFFNCEEFEFDGGDCPVPGDCTSWVSPSPTTGWSDFNNAPLTGAPVPNGGVCPFIEITGFEVWKSEAYAMDNVVVETCYTFSHCNGPGAGSWEPYYAIIAPSGAVDYEGLGDGDGCSVTWIASESGTYLIVINEDGNCGVGESINNGFPAITCNGSGCLTVDVAENNAANFSIFPNPNKGQFAITSLGQNGTAQVDVLEISGKMIQSQQVNFTANARFDVNIGNNAGGIYFVRITMNNEVKVHKVVVQ
jgi:hypothetical protein